jgi:hypothetical protein
MRRRTGANSGLLDREKRGGWVYYRARTGALASLATLIVGDALLRHLNVLHEREVRCSNRCSNVDARQSRRKAVPDQRPAAATPIDRCEPSLQPGGQGFDSPWLHQAKRPHNDLAGVFIRHWSTATLAVELVPKAAGRDTNRVSRLCRIVRQVGRHRNVGDLVSPGDIHPFGFIGCGTVANQALSATWRIRSASSSAVIAGCAGTVRPGWN